MSAFPYTAASTERLSREVETLASLDPAARDASFFNAMLSVRRLLAELETAYLAENREAVRANMAAMNRHYREAIGEWDDAGVSR